jgi:hypothetical protein
MTLFFSSDGVVMEAQKMGAGPVIDALSIGTITVISCSPVGQREWPSISLLGIAFQEATGGSIR